MIASFLAEMVKLYKRPAMWVLLALSVILSQVFNYLVPYAGYLSESNDRAAEGILAPTLPENLVGNSISGFPLFAGALALTLGALAVGGEYGWGTLKTTLTQRPRRLALFAGEILALVVAVFAIVLAVFVFGALTSYIIAGSQGEAVDWPALSEMVKGFASGFLILLMWCLFGAALAFVLRGVALPIGLGVLWILGIENLIVNVAARLLDFADDLQKFLPSVNAGSLVSALGAGGGTPGVNDTVDAAQAVTVLVCYSAVFMIIAAVSLESRDVT